MVHFTDPNLEMAVREVLKNRERAITADDMARLIELNAAAWGITDLSGLEYAVNLQSFDLGENQISDISPLADLVNLEKLALWRNRISDLSPIMHLANLGALILSENPIDDISPPRRFAPLFGMFISV